MNELEAFKEHEFYGLPQDVKNKLMLLMARIMEKAYRRGVQQSLHMYREDLIEPWIMEDLHSYRYGTSLDTSHGLDGFRTPSIERLMIEEHLDILGLSFQKEQSKETP